MLVTNVDFSVAPVRQWHLQWCESEASPVSSSKSQMHASAAFINAQSTAPLSDNYGIAFVPACDKENEHVAFIDFRDGLPEFLLPLRENPLGSWQVFVDELDDDLSFDRHFNGFTQLYDQGSSSGTTAE